MANKSRLLRMLVVASAGLATFYGAAQWSRAAKGASTEDVVQPAKADGVARATRAPVVAASSPAIEASGPAGLQPRSALGGAGPAFTRLSWLPPPPPPPPPPPAPPPPPPVAPTAPPLPFTFIGMVERGADKPQAFLSKGDALLIVAKGDLVDGNTYRVESLSPTQVVLTYLPLDQRQTIEVSGATK
jgi:hypothetical protein